MSIYLGSNLVAPNQSNAANKSFSNVNDAAKILMAHSAMPSQTYTNLTLGASGTVYTAPADGLILWRKRAVTTNKYVALIRHINNKNFETSVMWSTAAGQDLYANMQVSKGDQFLANYTADGTTTLDFFIFVYVNGSESEAS